MLTHYFAVFYFMQNFQGHGAVYDWSWIVCMCESIRKDYENRIENYWKLYTLHLKKN